jgi:ATP-dependent 26S proteasome regulatory subunit
VATANDPTALDPAILRRPGRFDRVVAFPNPNAELRTRYFSKLNPNLTDDELRGAVAECEGFSFAQLRESYILAGQSAFETGGDVGPAELLEAISALRNGMRVSAQNGRELGFSNPPRNRTLAAAVNRDTAEAR